MLLVDAANVVGSRPDGWWRDRAAAACGFVERLRAATLAGRLAPPVVVVLEGAARSGVAPGEDAGVRVLHATASGDDLLVELAMSSPRPVVLVSADRQLRRRTGAAGARAVGPDWLYARIDGCLPVQAPSVLTEEAQPGRARHRATGDAQRCT